ncbi:EAL domain-containing protein [Telmatospirillum siberiense]|nr:EAL domain-containing protein [Telmatospirillum siberiense]
MLNFSVPAGDLLFREDDPADCAYLVEEGWVEIYTERTGWRQSLSLIGPGEIFGEMGVIDGSPRTATAVAAEDCKLLRITVDQFQALLGRSEPFHAELLVKLVARFREAQRAWMDGSLLPRQESSAMGPGYSMLARHRDLACALDRGEIVPYLQPIVDLTTGRWRGFEALARWQSPVSGLRSPCDFLPLAERTGLIRRIDLHIAERVMRAIGSIGGTAPPYININFSAWHFKDDRLLPNIRDLLEKTGLDAHRMRVELTETLMLDDPNRALRIMSDLEAIGIKLALDDFGTGYSSLSVLHRMPIHVLKIDRTLVTGVLAEGRPRSVMRSLISLSRELGMEIVIEGVEDTETATILEQLGCNVGQGFLFAKPMPMDQAIAAWKAMTPLLSNG